MLNTTLKEYIEENNTKNRIINYYPEEWNGKYYKIHIRYLPNCKTISDEEIKELCEDVLEESRAVTALTDTAFARNGIMELSIATMNRNYSEDAIIKALQVIASFFQQEQEERVVAEIGMR